MVLTSTFVIGRVLSADNETLTFEILGHSPVREVTSERLAIPMPPDAQVDCSTYFTARIEFGEGGRISRWVSWRRIRDDSSVWDEFEKRRGE